MGERALITVLGNGNYLQGIKLLDEITGRLSRARKKHKWHDSTPQNGLEAITGELSELQYAVEHESPARHHDEALDVIATAIRFALREWEE